MSMLIAPDRKVTPLAVYVAALGVSSGELADRLLIGRTYMSSIIHGHRRPSRRLRRAIAQALSVPETTLFPEGDPHAESA